MNPTNRSASTRAARARPVPTEPSPATGRGELLTVEQAAERLNTGVRFVRRLIAERRITFVRVGRHVRIPESVLDEFIRTGRVEPLVIRWRNGRVLA